MVLKLLSTILMRIGIKLSKMGGEIEGDEEISHTEAQRTQRKKERINRG